jgi:hypothetical protein
MAAHYDKGTYVAVVEEQAFQESSTKKPMIVLKVRPQAQVVRQLLESGEFEEREHVLDTDYPRTIRLVISSNEKALDFLVKKLRYAGFTGNAMEELNLEGQRVLCWVKHEMYDGEMREQWDLALPPGESKPLENDPSLSKKINALLGRKLAAAPGDVSQSSVPESIPPGGDEPPPHGDDDLPF